MPIERFLPRVAVESTALVGMAYDSQRNLLEVEFRDGSVYQYLAVSAQVYENLLRAESKGTYFNREIRPRFKQWAVLLKQGPLG